MQLEINEILFCGMNCFGYFLMHWNKCDKNYGIQWLPTPFHENNLSVCDVIKNISILK